MRVCCIETVILAEDHIEKRFTVEWPL